MITLLSFGGRSCACPVALFCSYYSIFIAFWAFHWYGSGIVSRLPSRTDLTCKARKRQKKSLHPLKYGGFSPIGNRNENFFQNRKVCSILILQAFILKEALINSAPPSWSIFSVRSASANPPHSAAMRPVCLLDRTKNLHQSDGLHFISDSLQGRNRPRNQASLYERGKTP